MIPGPPVIYECPFCGAKKELMSLLSGNMVNTRCWSDNKVESPMLPRLSYVQKCPQCGKYYLLARQKAIHKEKGIGFTLERGILSFPEMVEAFKQLNSEGMNEIEEANVRLLVLHSYNDYFYRELTDDQPTEEDKQINRTNIYWLIENWAQDEILKAELYREAGDLDKAIEILSDIDVSDKTRRRIRKKILRRAKKNVTTVFEITNL